MKRTISILTSVAFVLALCAVAALAQDGAPKVVNGGVLNGKAVSLPKPEYPESARAARISGTIAVNVVIDEAGTVISAEADPYDQRESRDADGNKLDPVEAEATLLAAAENAARQARFSPTLLGGQPVQVKGRILYNFVAEKGEGAPTPAPVPAQIKSVNLDGGVINGKALELPAPTYPAAAKAVRAEGPVNVMVIVNEDGDVTAVAAVSGHPLLRAAAESAARQSKFSPTFLDGKPVKFRGTVIYNFVLPKKDDQP